MWPGSRGYYEAEQFVPTTPAESEDLPTDRARSPLARKFLSLRGEMTGMREPALRRAFFSAFPSLDKFRQHLLEGELFACEHLFLSGGRSYFAFCRRSAIF